ncbi:MAG: Bro-N domain-containing protein [archaeon]
MDEIINIENSSLSVFDGKKIRKTWFNNEWWFSIIDIVSALTDSIDPNGYLKDMRRRDEELSNGWVQIVHTLLIDTTGGKQNMNCTNTEGAFRIIQSITSPKAEPFKLWLARVGYQRIQEIQDPELAQKRMVENYRQLS